MAKLQLPRIMGHRGAAGMAPENTLAGIRRAGEAGAPWVEFDVMLTGDDVPVLFHDDSLERTTGVAGLTAETDAARLCALDAGSWFHPDFADQTVPSLRTAIAEMHDLGLRSNVEIKPSTGRDAVTAEVIMRELSAIWPQAAPPPLISCFKRECLEIAQSLRPDWPRAYILLDLPDDWREAAGALDCVSLHLYWKRLGKEQAAAIKAAGYGLACFTVDDPRAAQRLWDWGVDCMISDRPDRLVAASDGSSEAAD